MPGLSTKVQRLTQAQLTEFYSTCQQCFGGQWLHVAYSLNDESWSVYKFLCKCQHPGGLEIMDCQSEHLYNRPPDYSTADLPGYVYIHPRLNPVKARMLNAHLHRRKQELGIDEPEIDLEVPF